LINNQTSKTFFIFNKHRKITMHIAAVRAEIDRDIELGWFLAVGVPSE
jgi:hypothetical protein